MFRFGKKVIEEKVEKKIEKPDLLTVDTVSEQLTFENALRLLPQFNLRVLPPDFMYKDTLVLNERISKDEDGIVQRTDYVITPKRGVKKLSGKRIGIDSALSKRFDELISLLNEGILNISAFHRFISNRQASVNRYLVNDGWEAYTFNDIEILEAKADICKECKECNEITRFFGLYYDGSEIYRGSRRVNELRTYKINPPILGLFFGAGIHIAEVTHPCQYRSLDDLLIPKGKIVDPPEIKIIFPKQAS